MTLVPAIPRPAMAHLVRIDLASEGRPLGGAVEVVSAEITRRIDHVTRARLVIEDGDVAAQGFAVSDSPDLAPGTKITISLGHDLAPVPVFRGPVLRHRIELPAGGRPRLVLDLADAAVAMTSARQSRSWTDFSDGDVLRDVIGRYSGLNAEVDDALMGTLREQVVQADQTDGDFMVMRAERAGAEVTVTDGTVAIAPPAAPGPAALTLEFGRSAIAGELELDAAAQPAGVSGRLWQPAEQAVAEAADPAPALAADPGGAAMAAALGRLDARRSADEMMDAAEHAARLSALRGRVTAEGAADMAPGLLVELRGMGARMSGVSAVSGVHHRVRRGEWLFDLEFGRDPRPHGQRFADAGPSGGTGLRIATVVALAGAPQGEDRILVRLPGLAEGSGDLWARLALPHAGADRGLLFRPELGDEVIVGFLDGALRAPVVLGALHSSAATAPIAGEDGNDVKVLRTRSGLELRFDDAEGRIGIITPDGNALSLCDSDGAGTVEDSNGNTIELGRSGIEISAAGDLTLSGRNVKIAASARLTADGAAGTELTSSAVAVLKGALVQIN